MSCCQVHNMCLQSQLKYYYQDLPKHMAKMDREKEDFYKRLNGEESP